jgi:hypothetical protein
MLIKVSNELASQRSRRDDRVEESKMMLRILRKDLTGLGLQGS